MLATKPPTQPSGDNLGQRYGFRIRQLYWSALRVYDPERASVLEYHRSDSQRCLPTSGDDSRWAVHSLFVVRHEFGAVADTSIWSSLFLHREESLVLVPSARFSLDLALHAKSFAARSAGSLRKNTNPKAMYSSATIPFPPGTAGTLSAADSRRTCTISAWTI